MYDVLLSNATVITMDERRRVLDNGAVGIENGRIAFVGTSEEAESLEVKEVIDCKSRRDARIRRCPWTWRALRFQIDCGGHKLLDAGYDPCV